MTSFRKHADAVLWFASLSVATFVNGCREQDRLLLGDNRPVADSMLVGDAVAAVDSSAPVDTSVPRECPMENLTRRCVCRQDGKIVFGRQTCDDMGGWSHCECVDIPETIIVVENDSAISDPKENKEYLEFDWQRSAPTSDATCEPGYYSGGYTGGYLSSANALVAVPVFGDLQFELYQQLKGEFLEIRDGIMQGNALLFFPFTAAIKGTLDCSTGYLDGTVSGSYIIAIDTYSFQGQFRAKYDQFNRAFVDGVWSVTEPDLFTSAYPDPPEAIPGNLPPQMPIGVAGGTGDWSAVQ